MNNYFILEFYHVHNLLELSCGKHIDSFNTTVNTTDAVSIEWTKNGATYQNISGNSFSMAFNII